MARRARSGRAASGLLVAAVVAGGLAASLGAGYTVAKATLDDASTYIAKGNAVSHVNGESRQVDATSPGGYSRNREDVTTTPLPNGKVVAVNKQTGEISLVDGSTLQRTTETPGKKAGTVRVAPQVLVSGSGGWVVDHDSNSVRQIGGKDQRRVTIDGTPVDGAPARNGGLLVLTEQGKLWEVSTDHTVREIDLESDARGGALTAAGEHSYLVRSGGAVSEVDSGQEIKVAVAEGAVPLRDGRMATNSERTGGENVLIVLRDQIDVVDPSQQREPFAIRHGANTDRLGEPVEYRGRIYLPNFADHTVIVLDEKTRLPARKAIPVPGTQPTFFLSVDGDRLWANDQYSNRMVEIDTEGVHTIDKGKGNGVSGDKPKTPIKPTPPTGTPPPYTPPTGGGTGATTPPTNSPPTNSPPTNSLPTNSPPTRDPKLPSSPPKQETRKVRVPTVAAGVTYSAACATITAAGLTCQPIAVGSDGGDTDVVKEIKPGPGTELPEDSQVVVTYYGPTQVPRIQNATVTPADQCAAVVEATLTCKAVPADGPAPSLDQFGYVSDTSPAPGEDADTGSEVTVYYYAGFPMPQLANTNPGTGGGEACTSLTGRTIQLPDGQTKSLQCTAPEGTKDNNQQANEGKIYEQTPAAGATATPDQPIVLTVYGGKHTVADYAANGGNADAARADCLKWFSGCDVVEGDAAVGHPEDSGTVQKSDPAAGSTQTVGTAVKIYVWSNHRSVPDVTNKPIADACREITEAGFQCDPNSSHPDAKVTGLANPPGYPSQPAPGADAQLGATVVVPNATTPTVDIMAYPNSVNTVFVVRPAGSAVPDGYDANRGTRIATGYRVDAHQNWNINEFYCSDCDGHARNHFVSHGGKGTQTGTPWEENANSGGAVVNLMPPTGTKSCNTGIGQVAVWRVSNDKGGGRIDYGIVAQDGEPGSRYTEFLGCGWK